MNLVSERRNIVLEKETKSSKSQVSVVITLYNYENFIEETLSSLKSQTLKDLDVIVIDDHSVDNSLDVAKNWFEIYGNRFNNYYLVQNVENLGPAESRNIGFLMAKTKYMSINFLNNFCSFSLTIYSDSS